MQAILQIAKFTWLEARRSHYAWLIAGVVGAAFVVALFAADLAVTDTASYRSGVYAALVRIVLVLVTVLVVATTIAREQEERRLELNLSRPLSRSDWFLGRLLGHGALALVVGLCACLPVIAIAPAAAAASWGVSLATELCLVAAATLTAIVTLRQVTPTVIAVGAFYVLARSMQAIVLMSHGPTVDPDVWSSTLIATMVGALALLLPDLARYTQSAWLFADGRPAFAGIALEAGVYIVLLTAVGLIDLERRDDA